MTQRSRRDAAVARLIELSIELRRGAHHTDDGMIEFKWDEFIHFIDAVDAVTSIDLEVPDTAPIKVTAPLTSVFAGMVFRGPQAKHLAKRILREFWRDRPRHLGFTVDEMEELLDAKHQSVSPRISELRNAGWLVARGDTRPTRGGAEAEVYSLTDAAVRLLGDAHRE